MKKQSYDNQKLGISPLPFGSPFCFTFGIWLKYWLNIGLLRLLTELLTFG